MKIKAIIGVAAIAASLVGGTVASAATHHKKDSGLYLMGALGYGYQDLKGASKSAQGVAGKNSLDWDPSNKGGIAGRIALGYNFNRYFALEFGYNSWSDAKNKVSASITGDHHSDNSKVETSAFDLLAKGSIPFNRVFSIFGKAGLAAVISKNNYSVLADDGADIRDEAEAHRSGSHTEIRPELGIGADINFNESLTMEVGYNHIFGKGKLDDGKYTPNLDLATVGLIYKF